MNLSIEIRNGKAINSNLYTVSPIPLAVPYLLILRVNSMIEHVRSERCVNSHALPSSSKQPAINGQLTTPARLHMYFRHPYHV